MAEQPYNMWPEFPLTVSPPLAMMREQAANLRSRTGGLLEANDSGCHADFHALRHTFVSNLAAGGVHPKTAQRLARHSTIALTMDRYTRLRREDLAGALDTLPDLNSTRQVATMTGTDSSAIIMSPPRATERPSAPLEDIESANVVESGLPGKMREGADFRGELALNGSIAQRLEQGSHKPLVPGSNPGAPISPTPAISSGAGFSCFSA
jgi:hypothetical protein